MKSTFALLLVGLIAASMASSVSGDDWPQWRGPGRNGVSQETGLLREWPKDGPKLLWKATDIGRGYSTPSVVGERLYVQGNEGLEDEFVQALSVSDGKRVWRTRLGKVGNPNQQPKFPAARATPTVDGDLLYALGSDGDLACLETGTGSVRWKKGLRAEFGGKPGTWAYAESPLVDRDVLICTPGGSEATLLALDKKTGAVVWKSAVPGGDEAAYASAMAIEAGGIKQYAQMLQKGLVGVDAKTGKFLWRYDKTVSRYRANIPTPVVQDDRLYSAGSGTGGGTIVLKGRPGGVEAEPLYFSPKLPTAIGGSVLVKGHLYGTGNQGLICAEFATGNVKWEAEALGPSSLCFADGHLYLHGENGQVALVDATPDAYREKGRFVPPDPLSRSNPMEKAWAYPVVTNGRLYIRDHHLLWCYDVQAEK